MLPWAEPQKIWEFDAPRSVVRGVPPEAAADYRCVLAWTTVGVRGPLGG